MICLISLSFKRCYLLLLVVCSLVIYWLFWSNCLEVNILRQEYKSVGHEWSDTPAGQAYLTGYPFPWIALYLASDAIKE